MELLRRNYPFQIVAGQESGLDWLMSGIVGKTHSNGSRDRIVEAHSTYKRVRTIL